EYGDPDYPIWSGCWWGSAAEMPPVLLAPPYKKMMIQTEEGHNIVLDDTPGIGGITLETSGGQKIKLTSLGIEIDNGQGATIKLTGPQISLNNGALDVT
ncbi:MAG TPA: baseplate assembly protein, partial [Anaerolineae bacterium]|nr:baseplate assembly protein [Anaerolineae bacterium]